VNSAIIYLQPYQDFVNVCSNTIHKDTSVTTVCCFKRAF